MNRSFCKALLAAASILVAHPVSAAPAPALPAAKDFAREAAIGEVALSPDGAHIAGVVSPDGEKTYVAVWSTAKPDAQPAILGASDDRVRIMDVRFVKNDRLAVRVRQLFEIDDERTHLFKVFLTDLAGKTWTPALPEEYSASDTQEFIQRVNNPSILSDLPKDPNHILVVSTRADGFGDIFKVDVHTGGVDRIAHGSERYGARILDLDGVIRAREVSDFEGGKVYLAQQIRSPGGAWAEHFRSFAKDREITQVVAFSPDPNIAYVSSSKGRDNVGLYTYDIAQRKIVEPLFEHKLFDADDVIVSRAPGDFGRVLGFRYMAEVEKTYWVDPKMAAMAKALNQALGVKPTVMNWTDIADGQTSKIAVDNDFNVTITSWSDDLKYVIARKSGPNFAPEYYLLTDGTKLTLLGKARPTIDPAALGASRLIQYKARDGLMIPAMLHLPPKAVYGEGPYPAVVLPHGGPWGRDELDWDVGGWTQYLASRGYAVIQPQFRGSDGWSQKLWRAGDAEWGQKMQDDNDDAAKWLIDQKLAAPDRIALFGYSYGGYAAYAAAIRPNGLYQCAIAGAGVAELKNFQQDTFDDRFLREFQRPSIEGLDPLPHAKDMSIPIFIYQGDRDQTVDLSESHHMVAALKSAGKTYKYLEIKDMGHQYVTMAPSMLETQLVEIEKYLKNDCGPGGL